MGNDTLNIAAIRKNYSLQALTEEKVEKNPLTQFQNWLQEAIQAEVLEPTAMVLSTANENGFPSARVILLKGLENGQFTFFTNYQSRKGQDLEKNPKVALTFFWAELERQVRIEGLVQKTEPEVSDKYFSSRPRGSQVGAWVSPQSQALENRKVLEDATSQYVQKYGETAPIPRPPHWGGYGVVPVRIEFWQGGANRLHDRLEFSRENPTADWQLSRLAP